MYIQPVCLSNDDRKSVFFGPFQLKPLKREILAWLRVKTGIVQRSRGPAIAVRLLVPFGLLTREWTIMKTSNVVVVFVMTRVTCDVIIGQKVNTVTVL